MSYGSYGPCMGTAQAPYYPARLSIWYSQARAASARPCSIPEGASYGIRRVQIRFYIICGLKTAINSRTHATTALHECDFVRTFHRPQIPASLQVYGPETTRRSPVTLALVLYLDHMKLPGPVGNHTACRVGPPNVSKMFGPVRRPYFHTRTVCLGFCARAGRRHVDRLAGAVLAPTLQVEWHKIRFYLINNT